jgi:DNA recombination protein RmuC
MSSLELLVPLTVGFTAGLLLGWLAAAIRGRSAAADDQVQLAVVQERLEASQRTLEEQKRFLEDARQQLEDSFQALAATALKGSSEQFLALAEQRLKASRTEATADLDERRQAIESTPPRSKRPAPAPTRSSTSICGR